MRHSDAWKCASPAFAPVVEQPWADSTRGWGPSALHSSAAHPCSSSSRLLATFVCWSAWQASGYDPQAFGVFVCLLWLLPLLFVTLIGLHRGVQPMQVIVPNRWLCAEHFSAAAPSSCTCVAVEWATGWWCSGKGFPAVMLLLAVGGLQACWLEFNQKHPADPMSFWRFVDFLLKDDAKQAT